MDQHEILLKFENIEKRFPGVVALKSISLEVRAGEVQVLLGENGAGKSTLMKILAGEHAPTGGEIVVGGRKVSALTPTLATELGIGLVHQELSLVPALSVAENILLGRMPRNAFGRINWGKAYEDARRALEALGVSIDPTAEVRTLEVAEQQLIEITRVLERGPRILLLDEPTSALSDNERSRLFDVIRRLKQRGHGIIYISHHLSEIPMIADRVTVLRDGLVVETLPANEADEATVIRLMVGRRLEEQFPKETVELGAPVLAVENLASGRTLKDLSFTLRRGEILGIYGLMGAGQAEIANALFGLQAVKTGSIEVGGKRADFRHSSDAIAAGLGLISRDRRQSLVPMQPVGPNLSLSWLSGKSLLSRLDLTREREEGSRYISDLRIRPASTTHKLFFFSGGNQQKVILARWMSSGARILIFDEPTRGIDVGAKAEVFAVMSRLVSEGASILMISSELNELIGMADRVLVMRSGRLSAELPREEISQQNLLRYAS
ncbi:ATP-binding cassette domain-containing protein [Sinorhizobium meliloti]|uniref:sugar ABC transporter ATP-binding protein n=1 Tax=Rhizobium meliloti TaxID=382 RepID=UPI001294C330|nr:sugar ABC transporter ATP-binding protein [Sinorhizobium meliloti]MDW9592450.1 ATP-binding cassette domain-containing protein [Sinorhizobium meliloti]MDX0187090.1 ATP-binding cassette domain-containing protein [Sinorhizobium meliloti]MQV10540.1 ATP-binding cassette domain-containing protein [Sinorhizobium meliloti]MQV61568.1 ATP-binding cassette domain-containing protein [Sinorhizobium meliloti]